VGPVLTKVSYEKIQYLYWVPEQKLAWFDEWIYSPLLPEHLKEEEWRRPTYIEAQIRQTAYDKHPEKFFDT